jgi:DNA-binding transcriptional LysR family regulator
MPFDSYDLSDYSEKPSQKSKKREKIEIPESMKYRNSLFYKNNRMQQIRGFCNTIIYGSSVQASEIMGVTQAAVSSQIASLERDLELKLFNKKGRGLEPTEDGMRFFEFAMPIMKDLDNLYTNFLEINTKINHNELKIAAYRSAISWKLPKIIRHIKNHHPEVSYKIYNINRDDAVDKLRRGEIDLIFYAIDEIPQDMLLLKTIDIKPSLVVHKDSQIAEKQEKITIEDIKNSMPLIIDMDKISEKYQSLFKDNNIENSDIEIINSDWDMMQSFVQENLCCSFFGKIKQGSNLDFDLINIDISHIFPIISYKFVTHPRLRKNAISYFLEAMEVVDLYQ